LTDALDFHHLPFPLPDRVACEFPEGAFLFTDIGQDFSFEEYLCINWNFQIDSLALCYLKRLSSEGAHDTQFVLIHAGNMEIDDAGYLGLKPHVWVDISALPFLKPVPDNAELLRKLLIWCPDKMLFGTDATIAPWVPVGPEVLHLAACRLGREALYLALAGLVRDGLLDREQDPFAWMGSWG
jgi:hypothetical protein